jgi:hypothetical protein
MRQAHSADEGRSDERAYVLSLTAPQLARLIGGDPLARDGRGRSGAQGPGPGHSPKDRSLIIRIDPTTKAEFRAVIDEIAAEADRLITVLGQHSGGTVDLSQPAPLRTRGGRSRVGRKRRGGKHASATTDKATPRSDRPRRGKNAPPQQLGERRQDGRRELKRPASGRPSPPTTRMVAFAERLARDKRATLPSGYDKDFDICRRFLDQHAGR